MQCTDSTFHAADDNGPEGVTLTERFENFHAANPAFYDQIVALAMRFQAHTGRTCGVQRLVEIARWDIEMTMAGGDDFKVNNDFAAFYARKIMAEIPALLGFFKLRRADEADQWLIDNYDADVVNAVFGIDEAVA